MKLKNRSTACLSGGILILLLVLAGANPAFGAMTFSLFESGTSDTSVTVSAGGNFMIDVLADNMTIEGYALNELDAFTYRINFPNEAFTLVSNKFADPFDNALVPTGFNGSTPWADGSSVPILNGSDAGSPGATPFIADLYRTTASKAGIPAKGSVVVETLELLAPLSLGNYMISMDILEAVDAMGEFHTVEFSTDFKVNVVPVPSAAGLLAMGVFALVYFRRVKDNF
nr:hypothetical protein [uncultured Desulfobacter sp.]